MESEVTPTQRWHMESLGILACAGVAIAILVPLAGKNATPVDPPPTITIKTTLTVFQTASAVSVTATMPEHTTEHDLAERLAFLLREKGVDAKADGADVVLPMGWEKR